MTVVERERFPVLVPEAHTMGAIAVIRSLGRAGYPVHAVSPRPDAIGLRSKFCAHATECPAYRQGRAIDWFGDYVGKHGIRAIVPSEGFLVAVRPDMATFLPLMAVPQDEAQVIAALCKSDVHEALSAAPAEVRTGLPPSLISRATAPVTHDALAGRTGPFFLKVDAFHSRNESDSEVVEAATAEEAQESARALHERYDRVLIQGFVPGRGIGVFLLRWKSRELACFMHRRLHEVPHTGGASSLRQSIRDEAALDDARRKLEHLDWEGVAMMEYRREPSGQLHFIEMNARFWGSLHLALRAGVDFPTILLDALRGDEQEPVTRYRIGTRCRITFPRDAEYVWSRMKDRNLSLGARLWPIPEFFLNGLDPRVKSDLWMRGDCGLYWVAVGRFLRGAVVSVFRKLFRR